MRQPSDRVARAAVSGLELDVVIEVELKLELELAAPF
jgi:hypothetical protein